MFNGLLLNNTDSQPKAGPVSLGIDPTTSFSTATILMYTDGAGITAAAGTRLALQLLLTEGRRIYSFRLQDTDALHCHFLSLPHYIQIG